MNRIAITLFFLPLVLALALADPSATQSTGKPDDGLAALQRKLCGLWRGSDPCPGGQLILKADGTYERLHWGPGNFHVTGTWQVRQGAPLPTLVLTCKTCDAKELVGTTTEMKLLQVDDKSLFYQLADDSRQFKWEYAKEDTATSPATRPATASQPAEKGLQVTVVPEKAQFTQDEPLTIRVEIKNALDRPARLYTSVSHWRWRFQPEGTKGYWKLDQQFAEDRTWSGAIAPGKTAVNSYTTRSNRGQEYVFQWVGDDKPLGNGGNSLPVGRYRLTIEMSLGTYSSPTTQPEPWEGKRTTGPVEFEVVEKKP